jgi:hypothetical protein
MLHDILFTIRPTLVESCNTVNQKTVAVKKFGLLWKCAADSVKTQDDSKNQIPFRIVRPRRMSLLRSSSLSKGKTKIKIRNNNEMIRKRAKRVV